MYESHSVEDIVRHEADDVTTDQTISYILDVIRKSKENRHIDVKRREKAGRIHVPPECIYQKCPCYHKEQTGKNIEIIFEILIYFM